MANHPHDRNYDHQRVNAQLEHSSITKSLRATEEKRHERDNDGQNVKVMIRKVASGEPRSHPRRVTQNREQRENRNRHGMKNDFISSHRSTSASPSAKPKLTQPIAAEVFQSAE